MRFCEHIGGCEFPVFGTCKITRKGFCKNHQTDREDFDHRSITQKAMDRQRTLLKKNTLSKEISSIRQLTTPCNKVEDAAMDLFWLTAKRELQQNPRCQECSASISEKDFRAATAHIFPKSLFPSIAAHPLNRLFCGARCGCHNKTHRLDTFSDMKIFGLAVQRFEQFKHLIKEKHKYLDAFINYANGTM